MANRPIIDIAVDSSAFERFLGLFHDYSAEVDKMPEAWKRLNAVMGESGDASKALTEGALSGKEALALVFAQAELISGALSKAVKAQNDLGDASRTSNKHMSELAKTAKGLGTEIAGVGKWILKIGAGALVGLGVGGILSGFGIGELANAAFSRSRTAGGLGISPGQLASFGVNAQRFLGPDALQSAASAQLTYASAPFLSMLGIDFSKAQTMNAGDLAFEMLRGAVRNWQSAQKAGIAPGSSPLVTAYTQLGGNLEDVRRAAAAGLPALGAAQGAYRRDVGVLGFDAKTAAAWTNLKVQLDRAGIEIETVFITKLGPLAPAFEQLSKDVINAFAAFAESKGAKEILKDLKDGLQSLATWLGDPKTIKGFETFGDEIGSLAKKLGWLMPTGSEDKTAPGLMGHTLQGDSKWIWDHMRGWGSGASAWLKAHMSTPGFSTGYTPQNNPLDLTSGSSFGKLIFERFATVQDGIRAGADRLKRYPTNWGTKTLASALPLWSGLAAGSKAAEGYIANVEKWSGVSRNENIADFTRAQLAAVVAAMSRMEGTSVVTPEQAMRALYGSDDAAKKHQNRMVRAITASNRKVSISVTNSTASRVAISANAVATG